MGKYGHHVIDADGHGGDLPNWQARIPSPFQPQWAARRERIKQQFAMCGIWILGIGASLGFGDWVLGFRGSVKCI